VSYSHFLLFFQHIISVLTHSISVLTDTLLFADSYSYFNSVKSFCTPTKWIHEFNAAKLAQGGKFSETATHKIKRP